MKITIRQRWEEIEEEPPHPLDLAWWIFLFAVGVIAGAVFV